MGLEARSERSGEGKERSGGARSQEVRDRVRVRVRVRLRVRVRVRLRVTVRVASSCAWARR